MCISFANPDEKIAYEAKKLALIEEITQAFDGVSCGNGVTLHEAMVIDDYGSPAERAEARARDTEDKWQDVPEDDIRFSDAVLSFLDAKGFHYYLPAYMVWHLRNIDNTDPDYWSNTFDSVIFHLTYQVDIDDYIAEKFSLFTPAQLKTTSHFLQFDVEREETIERQQLQESLAKGGLSQSDIDNMLKEHQFHNNKERQALETYWRQFM
ncbi:hypothetical protein N836_11205 [Leptolyngbya sp. Heron Island J]|uniref:DUF6714 family protein n=1 Tax=Leptolyngbya sp. Heron Island J TaxID=1385935 RepID=UPI0003B9EA07|nr:DUF6714 family protein [Leptolyngbya sp. Heron Island J]ESA35558.1 hypothetical protein N836_11205 [Leptolyngbya sp. Heron Island J]